MRSLGSRRTARAVGAASVAVIALAGCSAGQVAETAILQTPISGLNTQSPDGNLLIRNLQVVYNNPTGYAAGASAPIQVSLYNPTEQQVVVSIGSAPLDGAVSARQVGLSGGESAASPSANPEPSGGASSDPDEVPGGETEVIEPPASDPAKPTVPATPTAQATQPARITLPPHGSAVFMPGRPDSLLAVGLSDKLSPGKSLNLVFEVSGAGQPLTVTAPFEVPLSPASRGPGLEGENHE